MTGVGSSPALATCETSHVLLAGVSGGFPGVLPFCPTFRLARLNMSEIILKGTLNGIKKKENKKSVAHTQLLGQNCLRCGRLQVCLHLVHKDE